MQGAMGLCFNLGLLLTYQRAALKISSSLNVHLIPQPSCPSASIPVQMPISPQVLVSSCHFGQLLAVVCHDSILGFPYTPSVTSL